MKDEYAIQYYDANSILLVNRTGAIRKLYCPFRVKCIAAIGTVKPNMYLWVDEVSASSKGGLYYLVLGKTYLHAHFEIMVNF